MEKQSKTKFPSKTCIICFCTFKYRNELFRHFEASEECAYRTGFVLKRAEHPESPTFSLKWSTLFHTPGLHEDLRRYFADAAIDRMEFCVSARTLVAATSHKMVQDALDAGVLQGLPIGRTGSYLEHERAEWLKKALAQEAPDGHEPGCPGEWDLCLSPRLTNAEASPEILVLVLRYFEYRQQLYFADLCLVRGFVMREWDLRPSQEEWQRVVIAFPALFFRRSCKMQRKIICLRESARTKLYKTTFRFWDYEEQFFHFLHQSGGLFFCLSSLKHSLMHYTNIPAVICDALCDRSTEREYIVYEDKCVRFEPGERRSPMCLAPVQSGDKTQCGCSQAHTTTELIAKHDYVLLPQGTSLVACDKRNKKFLKLDSGAVYNTSGVREFFRLQGSCGGALARNLCELGALCAERSNCAYIHLKTVEETATTSDPTGNFENKCSVEPMILRSILVDRIRTGQLRVALQEILWVWREQDSTITEDAILQHVDNAIASGQLVPFVVARTGSEACFFNANSKSVNAKAFLECSAAVLLLSPVLSAPSTDLLHVLYNYFRTEKARCRIHFLKDVCESYFALRPRFLVWVRLACRSKDTFKLYTEYTSDVCFDRRRKHYIFIKSLKKDYITSPTKARENVKERIEQLDHFIGIDSWPSVEVLLESAKRFGHEALRPCPGRRSRMLAMRWLLEEVAKKRGVPIAQFFEEAENTSHNFGGKRTVKGTFGNGCNRNGTFDDECEMKDTFDKGCITAITSFPKEKKAKSKLDDKCSLTITSFSEDETSKKDERGNECSTNTGSVLVHNEGKEDGCDCVGFGIYTQRLRSPWSPPMTGMNVAARCPQSKMQVPHFAWIDKIWAHYRPRRAYTGPARVVRLAPEERLARTFSSKLIHCLPGKVNATLANDILQRCGSAGMDPQANCVSRQLVTALVFGAVNQLDRGRRVTRKQTILSNWCRAKASLRGQGRFGRDTKQVIGSLVRSRKLKITYATRVGSVGLGVDTALSDHDILLELEHGDIDMVERVYDAVLELQRIAFTVAPFSNFANAVVTRRAFAVSITCYRRSIEFDIVPVTRHPDKQKPGLWQWNPVTQTWKENVMREIATKLQFLASTLPSAFSALRLVKIWNESRLPKLRVSSHPDSALKSPLINIHLVLLTLQARQMGAFAGHETTEQSVTVLLKYIETYWDCVTVPEGGLDFAQGYFTEIHAKYEASPRMLAEFPGLISRTAQQWERLCEDAGKPRVADEAWDDGKPLAVGEWDVDEVEAMLAQAGSIIGKMNPNPCSKADWTRPRRTPHTEE